MSDMVIVAICNFIGVAAGFWSGYHYGRITFIKDLSEKGLLISVPKEQFEEIMKEGEDEE